MSLPVFRMHSLDSIDLSAIFEAFHGSQIYSLGRCDRILYPIIVHFRTWGLCFYLMYILLAKRRQWKWRWWFARHFALACNYFFTKINKTAKFRKKFIWESTRQVLSLIHFGSTATHCLFSLLAVDNVNYDADGDQSNAKYIELCAIDGLVLHEHHFRDRFWFVNALQMNIIQFFAP